VKIKPWGDRILLKRQEASEKSADGALFIPDGAKELPLEAEVVALSDQLLADATFNGIYVGALVLIGKYAGTDITIEKEDFVIASPDEILGIVYDDLTEG